MRKALAYFFKFLFRCRALRRYHFALYQKLFKPYHLFRGVKLLTRYDRDFLMEVEVGEWIQQHIFFFGVYDEKGIAFIKKQLKPGDIFLDIGANLGTYSLSAAGCLDRLKGGMVYAFEPVPYIFERLVRHIEINKADHIVPGKLAIYNETTKLDLYVSDRENIGMSSILHHDTESGEVVEAEAIRMDDFIEANRINKVDLVKMDIEGAELFALQGMVNTLQKHRPALLIEISENVLGANSDQGREIFELMQHYGYAPYFIEQSGDVVPMQPGTERKETNYVFMPD